MGTCGLALTSLKDMQRMKKQSKTRIVLADTNGQVREALRAIVEKTQDVELAAEVSDGAAALQLATELAPDVVVLAARMADAQSVDLVRRIAAAAPAVKVLAVSLHADSRFAVRMIEAGASGYMLKDRAYEELGRAIRTVMSNRTYVSPGIAGIERDEE